MFVLYVIIAAVLVMFLYIIFRHRAGDRPQTRRLRRLNSVSEYVSRFIKVSGAMSSLRKVPSSERISPQLSERLMLAVSGVNECVNCSYRHAKTALEKGVEQEEIDLLLSGNFEGLGREELPAVLFAQHYAETRGEVSDEAEEEVERLYGSGRVRHMKAYLEAVLFGNLCCNLVDLYEHGGIGPTDRIKLLPLYLFSLPVSRMVLRGGKR